MAGEGAAMFGPLHQCSWRMETGALVLERGPVLTLGVEAAPTMKGSSSSTKRKAEVAALSTEDQPKRKAEEPVAAGCVKGEKPSDVVSAAVGGEDEAAKAAAGEEEPLVAGMVLRSGVVVDDDLIEHLEWVKTLNLPPLETLVPGLVFSNRRSDFYNESSSDDEEEDGEEVVQELNTN